MKFLWNAFALSALLLSGCAPAFALPPDGVCHRVEDVGKDFSAQIAAGARLLDPLTGDAAVVFAKAFNAHVKGESIDPVLVASVVTLADYPWQGMIVSRVFLFDAAGCFAVSSFVTDETMTAIFADIPGVVLVPKSGA